MEIAFIAPEITPYSRSDQVADICAALPKALRSIGHKVSVISPLWHGVDPSARGLARRLSGVEVSLGETRYACTLHDGRTTGGVDLVFVGQSELFTEASSAHASVLAALVLADAAAQVLAARSIPVEVVHAHGWFAAAALPLVALSLPSAMRVLSLHDLTKTGRLTQLSPGVVAPEAVRERAGQGDDASLLQAGVVAAQRVIAGSQTEALELLQNKPALAPELLAALGAERKLIGIANGLDAARWNPLTDPLLPARFDPVVNTGKARCKDALQLELELPVNAATPLIVHVAGGDDAGLAELLAATTALLHNDVQLVIAGVDPDRDDVRALSDAHPSQLRCLPQSDERGLHRAIAAADFLVLLGHARVYGDLHLAAQRYGALPIAKKTAEIADSIVDCDAELTTGTGFSYEGERELLAAMQRALAGFHRRRAFETLRRRVMQLDVSWERAARRYEYTYKNP